MKQIICFLNEVWTNLNHINSPYPFDGHSWVIEEEDIEAVVTTSKCEVCGKYEIGWQRK